MVLLPSIYSVLSESSGRSKTVCRPQSQCHRIPLPVGSVERLMPVSSLCDQLDFPRRLRAMVDRSYAWVSQPLWTWEITAVSNCCTNNCHLQEFSCASSVHKLITAGLVDGWCSLVEGKPEKVIVLLLNYPATLPNQLFAVHLDCTRSLCLWEGLGEGAPSMLLRGSHQQARRRLCSVAVLGSSTVLSVTPHLCFVSEFSKLLTGSP